MLWLSMDAYVVFLYFKSSFGGVVHDIKRITANVGYAGNGLQYSEGGADRYARAEMAHGDE